MVRFGLALGLAMTALAAPAAAQSAMGFCVAGVGCQYERWREADLEQFSCNQLWTYRNLIYRANGYCFSTARAIRAFGNDGCRYDNLTGVPLTPVERANVATVQRVERLNACPR
jgi:hypothetical protein